MKTGKLPSDKFDGPAYSIVAWCRGHEILFYREFGSYSGEWVMLSYCDAEYYIWTGYYGSCSYCDDFRDKLDGDIFAGDHRTVEFASDYHPFLEVPADTMLTLAAQDWKAISRILPANIRADRLTGYDWDALAKDVALSVIEHVARQ